MSPRVLFLICTTTFLSTSCDDAAEPEPELPLAVITSPGRDTTATWPYAVKFEGSTAGHVVAHHWDFGDGNVEDVEDPMFYAYAAPGTYTVTYRVTDADGLESLPARVVVTMEEPAGVAPEPGAWSGNAGFGRLGLTVDDQGTAITKADFTFTDWACGGAQWSGRIVADNLAGWPIVDDAFTIEAASSSRTLVLTVEGTFTENDIASGSWSGVLDGTTCTGEWRGYREPAMVVVVVSPDFSSTLRVRGTNCAPGRVMTLDVDLGGDGTFDYRTSARAAGIFALFWDGEPPPFDLSEGDIIRMYGPIHDVLATVLYVTLDSVDPVADVASGFARENTLIAAAIDLSTPEAEPLTVRLQVDASGTWSADFSGLYDIQPGTGVSVVASSPIIGPDWPFYGYTKIGGWEPQPPGT